VLVVISDKKLKTCTGDTVNYYTADVVQANDYYAFHATMSGRIYSADTTNKYRFGGSNGQEKDDEVFAGAYSAEYWEYDSRLGRRWNVDPVVKPHESSYATFSDNPIYFTDPNGDNPPEKGFFEKIGNMFNRAGNWLKGNAAKNRVNDYMKANNIDPKSVNINYGKDGMATITSNKRIESSVGADGTTGYLYNADVVTIYKNGIITKNTAWEQSDVDEAMASSSILAGSLLMKYAINVSGAQGGGGGALFAGPGGGDGYRNLSNSKQYPGISIYQNYDVSDKAAVTLPGFGIYIGGGYKGTQLTKIMQHEYGHYLDYRFSPDLNINGMGFTNFYLGIGLPSIFNAATGIGGPHSSFWTETRANRWAEIWFGKDYIRDPYIFPTK
jgi:hypothetical protein